MKISAIPSMLAMIPSVIAGVSLRELETIKGITRKTFPSVSQLSTQELAEWMASGKAPLLIDVRSEAEFVVSHLRGALNLRKPEQIVAAMRDQKPRETVLYCSVGFRSSRLAELVAAPDKMRLWNLEGSIFQWANEGRAVYCGEEPARQVHPYGRRWAGLLKSGLASDCQGTTVE